MFFVKNKHRIFIILIFCFCNFSCTKIIKNPVLEYNKEFLSKYNMHIRKSKRKHQDIAKEFGIYYTEDETKQLVDSKYYIEKINTKAKKNFKYSEKTSDEKTTNEKTKYIENDKSIYKIETNLKENKLSSLKEDNDMISYLEENYKDYKKEKNVNRGINLSNERLYGTFEERKNKAYYRIDNDELLVSFDYIDLLSRVRTDFYLQEQENKTVKDKFISIKEKIFNLFGGKKKK